MNEQRVRMASPTDPVHVGLLRTVVGYVAGRAQFTLDQIEDLKMAVDEASVQLLRGSAGEELVLELQVDAEGLEVTVSTEVSPGAAPVIDRGSFSWTILQALADELEVETDGGTGLVRLRKTRLADVPRAGQP